MDQLTLLPVTHETTVYQLKRLWGLDKTVESPPWFTWRCTCGRDLGVERTCAYSYPQSAERMAWWHRRNNEPWLNPLPAPPA